jgi:NhaP-type Na+/H+ or K+/H+ antiporter
MGPLESLSKITILLFFGLIMGVVAKKLKLPSMLLLIISGVILSDISVNGKNILEFNSEFLISASILALVMIVFKDSSNFTLRDLDTYSESALKIAILFLGLNIMFLSVAVNVLFNIRNILLSILFAAVMSGTDPGTVLSLFHSKSNKITDILKFESVINTPIVVIIPFIILNLMEIQEGILTNFTLYFVPFLQQIITGIGTGVFVGIIIFRFMRRFYSIQLSPLTLITSTLATYVLAENLGGNGVLAVSILGVFFGNIAIKKKDELQVFSTMLTNILEILVFVLIGFMLPLKWELLFLIKSLLLFTIMVLIRFAAIYLVYMHDHINLKEKIFMSLNCAKGVAVAIVAFMLTSYMLQIVVPSTGTVESVPFLDIYGSQTIVDLMVLFILYSIIVSSVAARFSRNFIRLKVEES